MWPLLNLLRVYAPYVTLPVAAVIGYLGYKIEGFVSDKYTPFSKSVEQEREERLLTELEKDDAKHISKLSDMKFVPKSIFERNVSPSLADKSTS